MKILGLSDIHGNFRRASKLLDEAIKLKPDLIAICGDITNFGSLREAERIIELFKDFQTIFVPGNCDPPELLNVESLGRALNIHGRLHVYESCGFAGIGGAPKSPFRTPIEFNEREIDRTVKSVLEDFADRLIVVSHSPPWNTSVDLTSSGLHVGSRALRAFVENFKPLAVLCGHVHEAMGVDRLGETLVVNPGPVRLGFYVVLEVDGSPKVRFSRV